MSVLYDIHVSMSYEVAVLAKINSENSWMCILCMYIYIYIYMFIPRNKIDAIKVQKLWRAIENIHLTLN